MSEARLLPGPRTQPPEWKGMGSCRCLCRTSTIIALQQQHGSSIHPTSVSNTYNLPVPVLRLLLLGLLVTTLFLTTSVSSFSLQQKAGSGVGDQCQIDRCWDMYMDAKVTLDISGGVGDDELSSPLNSGSKDSEHEAQCVALRTYMSCIRSAKNSSRGCHGNILYYSVRNVLKNQMKQYNCTAHGPTVDTTHTPVPPQMVPHQCQYHGDKIFKHCGLFGDPHLRTFNDQFQTCKVKGAWPLVNNEYLIVQVTNDPVLGGNGEATATSKLTVIVKSHPECGSEHYHTYQAQTDSLPAAFEDGSVQYGAHGLVRVVEVEPNKHVEIHIHYIATTIVVRQIGRYFTFAIHMPRQIVNGSTGVAGQNGANKVRHGEPELCVKGCPASERIDYKQYLAMRRDHVTKLHTEVKEEQLTITRHGAEEVCRESGLVDFYFDSCVFDLMATGDKNFTLAALSALKDVMRLDSAAAQFSNRTSLQLYDDIFNAATLGVQTVSWLWGALCTLSVLLTLWQQLYGSDGGVLEDVSVGR